MSKKKRNQDKKLCFVVMPFSEIKGVGTKGEWTQVFNLIKKSVESAMPGWICKRSEPKVRTLINDIIKYLDEADIVIADLTGTNPNVLYELGIRHTLGGRTLLISQRRDDIPSDLVGYPRKIYNWHNPKAFGKMISEELRGISQAQNQASGPVADFLDTTPNRMPFWWRLPEEDGYERAAMEELIRNTVESLCEIKSGQIPVQGGNAGYFQKVLEVMRQGGKGARINVFARLSPLEKASALDHIAIDAYYDEVKKVVSSRRLRVEYIFLVHSKESLQNRAIQKYLNTYKNFAKAIRLIYEDGTDLLPTDVSLSMGIFTDQEVVLTNGRDFKGGVAGGTLWVHNRDYEKFKNLYKRLKIASVLFKPRKRK